ncbi:hypothetical protein BC833DRAFT_571458, partial [Globomyces pollinis-pini]
NECEVVQLVEDYYKCSNNSVQKTLETRLSLIKSSPEILNISVNLLNNPNSSPVVLFFCLTTFEHHQIWKVEKYPPDQILQTRSYLWDLYQSNRFIGFPFVQNKLAKLIVDAARHQYPTYWPAIFEDICNIQNISLSGSLLLIKTVSEEFYSSRKDISSEQSSRLKAALQDNFPKLLLIISSTLSSNFMILTTGNDAGSDITMPGIQATPTGKLIPNPMWQGENGITEFKNLTKISFDILQQFLHIVNNHDYFWNTQFLDLLLKYSLLNQTDFDFNIFSISCLNELLSRPQQPKNALHHFNSIFSNLVYILELSNKRFLQNDQLEDNNFELFISKTIECIKQFGLFYLDGLISVNHTLIVPFITAFYTFTFNQSNLDEINQCANIWDNLAESIINNSKISGIENVFIQTIQQFSVVLPKLKDEGEDEITSLILDFTAKVSSKYSDQVINMLLQKFENAISNLTILLKNGPKEQLKNIDQLMEFSGTILIFGRLSNEHFDQRNEMAQFILIQLQSIITMICRTDPRPIPQVLALLNGCFDTISMFTAWMANYLTHLVNAGNSDMHFFSNVLPQLISISLELPNFVDQKYCISSSKFLAIVTKVVRIDLGKIPEVYHLLGKVHELSPRMDSSVCQNMWRFSANVFIYFPFGEKPNINHWNERGIVFKSFLKPVVDLIDNFCSSDPMKYENPEQVRAILLLSLRCINEVITSSKDGSNFAREITFNGLSDCFKHLPALLLAFRADSDGFSLIIQLLINIVTTFKKQISKTNSTQIIFETLSTCQDLVLGRLGVEVTSEALEECFEYFSIIVAEPSKVFERELMQIIKFAAELQLNNQSQETSMMAPLCELVGNIMLDHWNFFFGSRVISMVGKQNFAEKHNEFLALFQILALALTNQETDIVRENIRIIGLLNLQHNFYQNELFKASIFMPLVALYFDILLENANESLSEDLRAQLSDIIATDLPRLHLEVKPSFMQSRCQHMSGEQLYSIEQNLNQITDRDSCEVKIQSIIDDCLFFNSETVLK